MIKNRNSFFRYKDQLHKVWSFRNPLLIRTSAPLKGTPVRIKKPGLKISGVLDDQQTTKHPGGFFMNLQTLSEKIQSHFVPSFVCGRKKGACRSNYGLVPAYQMANHIFRVRNPSFLMNRSQFAQLMGRTRSIKTQERILSAIRSMESQSSLY